jgi:hypothetical protein
MKLLVTSDPHYRLKQFDWLVDHSHAYDAVAIVGDVLDISSMLDLDVQIDVIKKYLERISGGPTLLICSGNHDGNQKNATDEFIAPWLQDVRKRQLYVDGDNVLFGSTLITIFPGGTVRSPRGRWRASSNRPASRPSIDGYGFTMRRPTGRQHVRPESDFSGMLS